MTKDQVLKLARQANLPGYPEEPEAFAALVRADELVRPCCGNFDKCQQVCMPRAAAKEREAWLEILRNNRTATDEVIGAFLRGHAEHLTGETFVLTSPPAAQVPEGWKLVPSVPTNEWVSNLAKMQTGSLEEVSFVEIHQCIAELLAAAPEKGQP